MGGMGSGRYDYATTPTVEECRYLDVNELTDTLDHVGRGGRIYWGDPDDEDVANISFVVEGHDDEQEDKARGLRLKYSVRNKRTDETNSYDYVVPIEYTECNFGGERPWFRCPNTKCQKRVAKLYCPPRGHHYLCRDCHNLSYRSSRASGDPVETAELRYRRAFSKADKDDRRPHPNNRPMYPEKPKGMHEDTFEELLNEVKEARREYDMAFNEKLRDHMRAISSLSDRVL